MSHTILCSSICWSNFFLKLEIELLQVTFRGKFLHKLTSLLMTKIFLTEACFFFLVSGMTPLSLLWYDESLFTFKGFANCIIYFQIDFKIVNKNVKIIWWNWKLKNKAYNVEKLKFRFEIGIQKIFVFHLHFCK